GRAEDARIPSEVMTDARSRRMTEGVAKSCDALAQNAEREEASVDRQRRNLASLARYNSTRYNSN
ncbi:MAG: hypothetical protein JWL84_6276, partial [Rhodospirillales bacterium]|nr:hypothetical protein [Rhodospirillales bacterium]